MVKINHIQYPLFLLSSITVSANVWLFSIKLILKFISTLRYFELITSATYYHLHFVIQLSLAFANICAVKYCLYLRKNVVREQINHGCFG